MSLLLYFSKNTSSEIVTRFRVSVNGQTVLDDVWGLEIYLNIINIFMKKIPYIAYPPEIRCIFFEYITQTNPPTIYKQNPNKLKLVGY